MSSSAVGFGSWKKGGRVSDASAVTRNIRVVAQGQADATYAGTQKKNPFRMSQAILNTEAYGGQALSLANTVNLDRYFVPRFLDAFNNFPSLFQLNPNSAVQVIEGTNSIFLHEYLDNSPGSAFCKTPTRPTDSFVVRATVEIFLNEGNTSGTGFSIGFVSDPTWVGGFGLGVGLITFVEGATPPPGLVIQFLTTIATRTSTLRTTTGTELSTPVSIDTDVATALIEEGSTFVITVTYNHLLSTIEWVLTEVGGNNYTQTFGPFSGININELLGGSDAYIGLGAASGTPDLDMPTLSGLTYTTFQP